MYIWLKDCLEQIYLILYLFDFNKQMPQEKPREKHVASPAGDRPSVYRISALITPTTWQYVFQHLIEIIDYKNSSSEKLLTTEIFH